MGIESLGKPDGQLGPLKGPLNGAVKVQVGDVLGPAKDVYKRQASKTRSSPENAPSAGENVSSSSWIPVL